MHVAANLSVSHGKVKERKKKGIKSECSVAKARQVNACQKNERVIET
jgi:hypothetical protein